MSVRIMSLVWDRASYSGGSLLILLALADWSNDEGYSWPSVETLAKKARIKRRATQYAIRELEQDGILKVEEGRGRSHQNTYQINVQKLHLLPSIKGAICDVEKAQSATEKVHPTAPDPLVDTSTRSIKCGVEKVFNFWKEHLEHPKAILDGKRKRLITLRLKEYSVEDLITAIRGCKKSAYHMGANEQHTVYDGLELILRDSAHIERFISLGQTSSNGHKLTKVSDPEVQAQRRKDYDAGRPFTK